MQEIETNQATAELRRMYFGLVDATDGITPETGEANGQPQISYNGDAYANTNGLLVATGNGKYYAQLTQAEVNKAVGTTILGRYKSANTAEGEAIPIRIVQAALGDVVEGTLTLKGVLRILLAAIANLSSGGRTTNIKYRDLGDTKDRIDGTVDANGNRTSVTLDVSD
jgi:hypothetical protein